jgi:hypothetical protein
MHDVLVAPVSVCYEEMSALSTLLDVNATSSLSAAFQILRNTLRLAWQSSLFTKSYGQVRVNFGQPFSLKV